MRKHEHTDEYNTKPQEEIFRERIRITLIGIFLISVYLTGLLDFVLFHLAEGFAFGVVLKALFSTKLSLLLFPVIFFLLSGLAIAAVHKTWEEAQREDKLKRGFLHSKNGAPYGDAHFAQPWEFADAAQIRPVEECKGIILGQLDDAGRQCIDFNPYEGRINSHMIAIGRSGVGKTFTFVKSYMMQAMKEKHSLFIADPKGDLFRETSSYFRDNGYVVRKLDLKNLEKSDGWHCLGSLHGANLITNVQVFSSTVMANISERDDVYSRAGGSLLSALILRVLQGKEYPPEKKTIKTVHELLQNPGGIDFLDSLLSHEHVTSAEEACTRFYMDFKRASGNLAGNIITHLATGIQLLNNPLLSDILSTDDIDLTKAGQVPSIYYLNFPDTDVTFRFIISLFFSMAFINLVDYADIHTSDGKLPVPVDFLLDEFPALGVIPDWDRKIATVRSRQINCVMIIQDIPQLKKRYLESWMTILNNCGCMLILGINESHETAPYLSQRIGETSIEVISKSESVVADSAKSFMSKQSTGVGKRAFLAISEICELSRDGSVILFADHQPIYAKKFPFVLHPDAEKMEDTLPQDVIDFSDRAGRHTLRQAEIAYRQEFWETHPMHPDMKYKDLSGALFMEPPQDPTAMVISMLRDDFTFVRKCGTRLIQKLFSKEESYNTKWKKAHVGTSEKQKPNLSAEKGAFQKFLDHYRRDSEQQFAQFNDLSIEIDTFSGEILSIQEHPAESPKSEIKPAPETVVSEEQGLNSTDRMKEPDPSGQALQRRGRSLKSNAGWNAFSIPAKAMKEPPATVQKGNLPKAKS